MIWPKLIALAVLIINPFTQSVPVVHSNNHLHATDVLIDVGHGGKDGGTVHDQLLEKDLNLMVAKELYKQLSAQGLRVVLNRTADYALSDDNGWLKVRSRHMRDLAQRKELAKQLNPQLMISLHVNWSPNPKKNGPLLLHQKNEESLLLANHIQDTLNQLYGTHTLPVFGKTFFLLNHVPCPTVIVEMGFISNSADRNRLTHAEGQKEIAAAISSGVKDYLAKNI